MRELKIRLSRREEQCLHFSAQDLNLEEIADKMHVSYASVKFYRRVILRKLSCKTMGGALCQAARLNLIKLE